MYCPPDESVLVNWYGSGWFWGSNEERIILDSEYVEDGEEVIFWVRCRARAEKRGGELGGGRGGAYR